MTAYIQSRRSVFGVEPTWRVLGVATSTHYARLSRPASARAIRDAQLIAQIHEARDGYRSRYGVRKTWKQLRRNGVTDAGRERVARLMRQEGLRGVQRGRKPRTTRPDEAVADQACDLVNRDFTAERPNELWVADFTYVRTWQGFSYLAFILDVYSRMIVGWQLATHMRSDLVVDALEMAAGLRQPAAGELVAHTDHGSQGGFKWSWQRLVMEVVRGGSFGSSAGDSRVSRAGVVAWSSVGGEAGGSAAVLAGDRWWLVEPGGGWGGRRLAGGWQPMVSRRWRDVTHLVGPAVGALLVIRRARGDRDLARSGVRCAGDRAAVGTFALDDLQRVAA